MKNPELIKFIVSSAFNKYEKPTLKVPTKDIGNRDHLDRFVTIAIDISGSSRHKFAENSRVEEDKAILKELFYHFKDIDSKIGFNFESFYQNKIENDALRPIKSRIIHLVNTLYRLKTDSVSIVIFGNSAVQLFPFDESISHSNISDMDLKPLIESISNLSFSDSITNFCVLAEHIESLSIGNRKNHLHELILYSDLILDAPEGSCSLKEVEKKFRRIFTNRIFSKIYVTEHREYHHLRTGDNIWNTFVQNIPKDHLSITFLGDDNEIESLRYHDVMIPPSLVFYKRVNYEFHDSIIIKINTHAKYIFRLRNYTNISLHNHDFYSFMSGARLSVHNPLMTMNVNKISSKDGMVSAGFLIANNSQYLEFDELFRDDTIILEIKGRPPGYGDYLFLEIIYNDKIIYRIPVKIAQKMSRFSYLVIVLYPIIIIIKLVFSLRYIFYTKLSRKKFTN